MINLGEMQTELSDVARVLLRNTCLTSLTVTRQLSDKDTSCIAEVVAESESLLELHLRENGITHEALQLLCEALRMNNSLPVLEIGANRIGDGGAILLANLLRAGMRLRTLNLRNNGIGSKGIGHISKALMHNTSLHLLNVSDNPLHDDGVQYLSSMLHANTTLRILKISRILPSIKAAPTLCEALRVNKSLTHLHLGAELLYGSGERQIADMLRHNTSLRQLFIYRDCKLKYCFNDISAALFMNMTLVDFRPLESLTHMGIKWLEMNATYRDHHLHLAACKGRLDVVRRLLQEGYSVAATHDTDGTAMEAMVRWSGKVGPSSSSRDIMYALEKEGGKYEKGKMGTLGEMMIRLYVVKDEERLQDGDDCEYYWRMREGASALPFMKASYSPKDEAPLVGLPPEMLERVYMYCTSGRLSIGEVRQLYPVGVLYGMGGMTDREIVHEAVVGGLRVSLCTFVAGIGEDGKGFNGFRSRAASGAEPLFTSGSGIGGFISGRGVGGVERAGLFDVDFARINGRDNKPGRNSGNRGRRRR